MTKHPAAEAGAAASRVGAAATESGTIRLRPAAHAWLAGEARARAESMPEVVDRPIGDIARLRFAADARAGYARLRRSPDAWADFRDEVATLDGTAADGPEGSPREGR